MYKFFAVLFAVIFYFLILQIVYFKNDGCPNGEDLLVFKDYSLIFLLITILAIIFPISAPFLFFVYYREKKKYKEREESRDKISEF